MNKSYFEKLKDPRWQKKRLECFDHYGWKCELCGDNSQQLQIHHKEYLKGWQPWDYDFKQLAVLCHTCHAMTTYHDSLTYLLSFIPMAGSVNRDKLAFFVAGLTGMQMAGTPKEMAWFALGAKAAEDVALTDIAPPSLPEATRSAA